MVVVVVVKEDDEKESQMSIRLKKIENRLTIIEVEFRGIFKVHNTAKNWFIVFVLSNVAMYISSKYGPFIPLK